MKIKLNRGELLEKLNQATRFTSTKFTSSPVLQGVYVKSDKNKVHFYSSNLNSFFHTFLKVQTDKEEDFIIEPKKLGEFLALLPEGKIELEVKEKQIVVIADKTKGKFPLMNIEEFPLPPKIEEKEQKIKTDFFTKSLPLVLFAAATDETRPALSGVNFLTNDELIAVATDGFRLSLVKTKKDKQLPSAIIPSDFLKEVIHFIKGEKEIDFAFSLKEKLILFKIGDSEFYSRLIEGDFPPFEKVIPQEKKTTIIVEREDLLRDVKLVSVFARDFSNIIIMEVSKGSVKLRPKMDDGEDNSSIEEAQTEGEEQKIAFNYRFLLDFLNSIDSKRIIIEVLRSDAPVVFKVEGDDSFLHIIMPVRIQE